VVSPGNRESPPPTSSDRTTDIAVVDTAISLSRDVRDESSAVGTNAVLFFENRVRGVGVLGRWSVGSVRQHAVVRNANRVTVDIRVRGNSGSSSGNPRERIKLILLSLARRYGNAIVIVFDYYWAPATRSFA